MSADALVDRIVIHHPRGRAVIARVVGWWHEGEAQQPVVNLYLLDAQEPDGPVRVDVGERFVTYVGRGGQTRAEREASRTTKARVA